MKKFADTVRRLLSIALNLFIVWAEPIALPMSWDWGKEQMFIFYTEDSNILSACICAMVAVGQLVCIFTGRELPRWLHTLKYIATCCLTMTFLTVVFVLGPMYEDGNGWYIMLCTSSMLYHPAGGHLLLCAAGAYTAPAPQYGQVGAAAHGAVRRHHFVAEHPARGRWAISLHEGV